MYVIGFVYSPIYYFSVKKMDLSISGRGDNFKLFTKTDSKVKKEYGSSTLYFNVA